MLLSPNEGIIQSAISECRGSGSAPLLLPADTVVSHVNADMGPKQVLPCFSAGALSTTEAGPCRSS